MSNNYAYKVWKKILAKKFSLEHIMHELTIAKLATPTGANFINELLNINRNNNQPKYVICCANDEEPGTFKDRDLLLNHPEQLLEGIAIVGFMLGANIGYLYINPELVAQFNLMQQTITNAYQEQILGKNLLNTAIDFDVYALYGSGGYITREASAMLAAIEGKPAFPRINAATLSATGLYGNPTIIINVETLINLPKIVDKGGEWYLKLSKNKFIGGTKIFSISGNVVNPGNYEVPFGIKFNELLKMAGGVAAGKKLKAVLPNGISSSVLPAAIISNLNLDYSSFLKVGATLGAGGMIIMDETTCMIQILARISRFFMQGSCGQCAPCREGTGWLYKIVARIAIGQGNLKDLTILDNVADGIYGKNMCPLGDNAAILVKSFIKYFREEFVNKLKIRATCPN